MLLCSGALEIPLYSVGRGVRRVLYFTILIRLIQGPSPAIRRVFYCAVTNPSSFKQGISHKHSARLTISCVAGSQTEDDVLLDGMDTSGVLAMVHPPPPYSDVTEIFGILDSKAEEGALHDVPFYLRKAKIAWISAYANRNARQSSLLGFMEA